MSFSIVSSAVTRLAYAYNEQNVMSFEDISFTLESLLLYEGDFLNGAIFAQNDRFVGSSKNETFWGYGGSDEIVTGAGNDYVNGGTDIDTVVFSASLGDYSIANPGSQFTVTSLSGDNAIDTLLNVERLRFSDISVALDLAGNAGVTAKVLGAVFGAGAISNQGYVGIGLNLLDTGTSYEALMELALNAAGAVTNDGVVQLLYTNLVGSAPSASVAATYIGLLDDGMSRGALGVMAADDALNLANIDLVGLTQTGIEFI